MPILTRIFPFLGWFKNFKTANIRTDFISGLTVALVLIPQSMAYAQLAGLPPYYGLYAAFLPPIVASLFGSSNQLATGPVAVVSLMTAAAIEPLATAGKPEYVAYAILLALLVGLFQFALGALRLGLIVNFLSHPVVNGFTNAAAIIIATSQLSKVFGVNVDSGEHHFQTVYMVIIAAVKYTHWPTFGMAALAFAIMISLKRINPRIPNVLVAVALATFLAWIAGYEKNIKVDISRIESEKAQNLIHQYNATVKQKNVMDELLTNLTKSVKKGDVGNVCVECHSARDPSQIDGKATIIPRSGQAMALHYMAGLIDQQRFGLKADLSRYRAELNDYLFESIENSDGKINFYLRGELPNGLKSGGKCWRLKIGNREIKENEIIMTGGGAVVGSIPKGLPKIAMPDITWSILPRLFVVAMIISLLGFMEAISIAKAMAARTHQKLDPNQELIGQGLANIIGSMSQSYAVSGSFSRSAVNLQAGAVSGLSNVFSSGVVVVALFFLTPLLYNLPQAVLAAIIMMAVISLINVAGFVHAWKAQKFDGITAIVAFVGTLVFAPHLEWGIAMGVALSLGAYLYRTMKPAIAELSLHPDGSLRDVKRHELAQCKHIAVIRFNGPLNFANTSYLEEEILGRVADLALLKHVLIVSHGINEIDASGEEMLSHIVERLREARYEVSFSGLNDHVLDVMKRTHLYEKIGEDHIFPTQAMAIVGIHEKSHLNSEEKECPLLKVVHSNR